MGKVLASCTPLVFEVGVLDKEVGIESSIFITPPLAESAWVEEELGYRARVAVMVWAMVEVSIWPLVKGRLVTRRKNGVRRRS